MFKKILYFIIILIVVSGVAGCKNPVADDTTGDPPPVANSAPYNVTASFTAQTYNQNSGDQTFQLEIDQVDGLDDPDGDVVSFKSSVLPAWIVLDEVTGVVTVDTVAVQSSTSIDFWSEDVDGEDTSADAYSVAVVVVVVINQVPTVTFPGDLLVSGAGTSEVDGFYEDTGSVQNTRPVYSQINGMYRIFSTQFSATDYWCIDVDENTINTSEIEYVKDSTEATVPLVGWAKGPTGTLPVPVFKSVPFTGESKDGQTLEVVYNYEDAEGEAEDGTSFQWYRYTIANPEGLLIPGASAATYLITTDDVSATLRVEITPQNVNNQTGTATLSPESEVVASNS